MTDIIFKYFPDLTSRQKEQIEALDALYREWNAKINVISRKDIDNLYEHHVLHSMAIGKVTHFTPGSTILDFGTGGGFPGVHSPYCFLNATSSSSTVRERKSAWRRRFAKLSA